MRTREDYLRDAARAEAEAALLSLSAHKAEMMVIAERYRALAAEAAVAERDGIIPRPWP